jgi:hypothetical protein
MGTHRGGYDGFTFNLTAALKPSGDQEIVVAVWDPTDTGSQPRGKQVLRPGGIMYTPTSGLWQTAWLEPVSAAHLAKLRIVPDLDRQCVRVTAEVGRASSPSEPPPIADMAVTVEVTAEGRVVATQGGKPSAEIVVPIANPKLWSPDSPFLYGLGVMLGKEQDRVTSYFGMRKIALGKDDKGILRLCLNNQPLFQLGPLDQGFWPDGLYTAPTDEALRYDIEMTRALGFNVARKHVKVEPERWYYWCDKLGLLVWQDMPSGNFGARNDQRRSDEISAQYELELKRLVEGRGNHPCIVMWVPFNEGWGQHETPRYVELLKQWDPSRLVDNASGWADRKVGDVNDIHSYPGPAVPRPEDKRALVLGEFGGLGLPLSGHTWQAEKNWGYRNFKTSDDLTEAYLGLIKKLHRLTGDSGLSAAVYTQTTDVEVEVNGLMTYDRATVKMDQAAITAANKSVYAPPQSRRAEPGKLIPPATPLVACDPYFSIWSPADRLTDEDTVHWTGKPHRLTSLARIDGKPYRLMGASPATVPPLEQTSLEVWPTRTIYKFQGAGVALDLAFMTPALPEDIDLLSRPVTYVVWQVRATDGQSHHVKLYFGASGEITVNTPNQTVVHSQEQVPGLTVLKVGSKDQPILAKKGDDLRIDWGYLYLAAPEIFKAEGAFLDRSALSAFANPNAPASGVAPAETSGDALLAIMEFDLSEVGAQAQLRWLMLAYDDLYSIQYMRKNLRPYWRRNGWDAAQLLQTSALDGRALWDRCSRFDEELMADLTQAGGEKYARLCALAYRQCFAAGKFVADASGQPLQFCKENHSNGCIGTSDVFYPMAPQFLLFGPSVAKSFLVPFMNYAASSRWKFPFAPHDLGTYPHANGQVYGGGERTEDNQMPVEESGNLLLLLAAVAQMEGNADFAARYWPALESWAAYLQAKGFDPENQLCTDDFAGHLAHNVNLSAKAICALGAFGKLCDLRGDQAKAQSYAKLAKDFAARWVKESAEDDHFRLAFDRPNTWSQKYNLVWDRILGLGLFPEEVLRKEMDYYKRIQNRYGLPLDNRATYTKLDWTLWTATLTRDRADFDALVSPVFLFMNETPDRLPLTDWYQTKTAQKVGFTGRPVIGGVFLQMLYDRATWSKYAGRDQTKAANWAPMPKPPKVTVVLPTSQGEGLLWRYTTQKPAPAWFQPGFEAAAWKEAPGGFGTPGTPGAVVRTEWNTPDIWLRRPFILPEGKLGNIQFNVHHDEDVEIYLNGVLAASASGFTTAYEPVPINPQAQAVLKPGPNLIAVHCRQTSGGQYIDVGFVNVVEE